MYKTSEPFYSARFFYIISKLSLTVHRHMRSLFCYLLDELRCNEICLWQNKSAYVDEIAIAMKSDFVGLWWQISYHPRLASDFI